MIEIFLNAKILQITVLKKRIQLIQFTIASFAKQLQNIQVVTRLKKFQSELTRSVSNHTHFLFILTHKKKLRQIKKLCPALHYLTEKMK